MSTAFRDWLQRLVAARFPSRRAFVRVAESGRDENTAQASLAVVLKGRRPPPLERIADWADALDLAPEDRRLFLDLAAVEHLPASVRDRFRELVLAAPSEPAADAASRRRMQAAERRLTYDAGD